MRIQHNIMAMNAYRNYTKNTSALAKNLEKLSSGYRINRAGDDAAGLAISEKMRAQITGLEAAQKNVKDGVSLVNTAEGAMQEVHDMLNRMVYLATESANGTYDNAVDRKNLQQEIDQLKEEINRIADSANFNGIKLLDGVSGSGQLTKVPVEYETVSTTAGITLDKVQDGAGSQGVFTIDISKKFSVGDAITFKGTLEGTTSLDGTTGDVTLTMGAASDGFDGDTIEEQAQSIANALTGKIGGYYNVKAEGSQVIITAIAEGTVKEDGTTKVGTITGIDVTTTTKDVDVTDTHVSGAAASSGTPKPYKGVFEVLGGAGGTGANAGNIAKGDILTFEFTDAVGNKLEAKVEVTEEMANASAEIATAALAAALSEAKFEDNKETTGSDESLLKVGDLFTVQANTAKDGTTSAYGSIYIAGKANPDAANAAGTMGFSAVKFTIDKNGSTESFNAVEGQAAAKGSKPAVADKHTVKLDTTNGAGNFTAGDKVKITGTLADGRNFEVILEAGKDFEIDKNTTDGANKTVAGIADALKKDSVQVILKDGTTNEVITDAKMTGADLFGDKGEFTVTGKSADGELVIESKHAGAAGNHAASTIDEVVAVPLDAAEAKLTRELATAQGSAKSSFTFDDKLSYGAAVTVGDNTYEIVADARDTSNRNNIAVVVKDPTDSAAVAKAMADAINGQETDYTADYNGSTVTVASNKIGSAQKALNVTMPYGDSVTTAKFAFDPAVVKNGSTLTFNDQKYEFVTKGGKASDSSATAIEVADFSKATSKELGDAFLAVFKNGSGTIDEDGTLTLKSQDVNGTIADPVIKFDNYMNLQIGDTSDSFNQLRVDLADLHTRALGIDGINIGTAEGAAAAIDVIKDAINTVSSIRGKLGAISNRLDHTSNNLSVMRENIQDAESSIRDTDVADEMMAYTKNNILVQSAQAMLAQANQVPQGVLQLLQ